MTARAKIEIRDLRVRRGNKVVLDGVSLDVLEGEILAVIGPAGAGKTTLLQCINRMTDMMPGVQIDGTIRIDGQDITGIRDVSSLRRRIGVVFPLPVGLPMSIYDNVAFAPRMAGIRKKAVLDELVERCLRQAALFDEVKDRLSDLGTRLSGGQQQRLTIARALSLEPEILCLDEFSIAVDPVTTMRIEEVIKELRKSMTVILVTNLVLQARRLGDRTALFLGGRLVEVGATETIFSRNTKDARTFQYVQGLFG
ncbi:MAG TPA: phosphate ABC transporter ATP-binding protein [Candidatus Limnocylindrales bacterium]|nr:phosphate ABC transporter ATP-binding protein [Candidatus Limnocylindrales bacterium]